MKKFHLKLTVFKLSNRNFLKVFGLVFIYQCSHGVFITKNISF